MKRSRPGILSVRAVNQYRRRDVLTYLGLRYYLENSVSRTDQWAKLVATDLVLTRTSAPYFHVNHFKEITDTGAIELRAMFLPGANEALAEAALLNECANHPLAFANPPCVFSHELNQANDRSGVFRYYTGGLQKRQQAIAVACDNWPNGVVLYTDIKRFYPSIGADLAIRAWRRQSDRGSLSGRYRDLGEKLITEHSKAGGPNENGILTGPMFSHLLANLVLREMDEDFAKNLPAKYFRYVDDIALVGNSRAVSQSLVMLRSRLSDLGFSLQDATSPKHIEVPVVQWLEGRNDFRGSHQKISWPTFIGDLKRFLLLHPAKREELQLAFRNEGFRIPVRNYSSAVYERSFLEKILRLSRRHWFRLKSQAIGIQALLDQAKWLRDTYESEFRILADRAKTISRFERKRSTPKLRYRAGRLIYLATDDKLASLYDVANELQEVRFHALVMDAVASGNIDEVLRLGTNAAQAAAQPLRAAGRRCTTTREDLSGEEQQALAIFFLNGVPVDRPNTLAIGGSDLMRFATSGTDINLMKNADPFIRELASLHGISEKPRHPELLEAAFDEDEDLAMDAINQLQQSLSL